MAIDPAALTSNLKVFALELGFDDIGIADATLGTPYAAELASARREGRFGPLDYMERTFEERSDVQKLMPGAKSVVVLIKNYYTGDHVDHVPSSQPLVHIGQKISRYAWGRDYHHWFKNRLRKIRQHLEKEADLEPRVHIFNDTGPVLERGWAERAGLGFIGKSNLFIHREFGTWTFLGGLVTDVELEYDAPWQKQNCGKCTKCLDACPTGALIAPNTLDASKCLSTWNIERPLHPDASDPLNAHSDWLLGCDICQEVCPWNSFQKKTSEPRFQPLAGHVSISRSADIPPDLRGTPLARPGREGLSKTLGRITSEK